MTATSVPRLDRAPITEVLIVGAGDRVRRRHLAGVLEFVPRARVHLVDPDGEQAALSAAVVADLGGRPVVHADLTQAINSVDTVSVAIVASPNRSHAGQTVALLTAGFDALVEKPLTLTDDEAVQVLKTQAQSHRLVVGAFQGSLSPTRERARRFAAEAPGMCTFIAVVAENWVQAHAGTWRQDQSIAGGDFLFDSGIHMLHAISELFGPAAHVHASTSLGGAATATLEMMSGDRGVLVTVSDAGTSAAIGELTIISPHGVLRTSAWGRQCTVSDLHGQVETVDEAGWGGPFAELIAIRDGDATERTGITAWRQTLALWQSVQAATKGIF